MTKTQVRSPLFIFIFLLNFCLKDSTSRNCLAITEYKSASIGSTFIRHLPLKHQWFCYHGNMSVAVPEILNFPQIMTTSIPSLLECCFWDTANETWLGRKYFTGSVACVLTGQHVLEFDGINRKDAGTYNVTASNKYGDEQVPCTLMVTENPQEAEDWAAQLKKT